MAFFNSAVGVLQTLVVALGAGLQSAGSNRRFCEAKRTRCGASGLNLYLLKSADTL